MIYVDQDACDKLPKDTVMTYLKSCSFYKYHRHSLAWNKEKRQTVIGNDTLLYHRKNSTSDDNHRKKWHTSLS